MGGAAVTGDSPGGVRNPFSLKSLSISIISVCKVSSCRVLSAMTADKATWIAASDGVGRGVESASSARDDLYYCKDISLLSQSEDYIMLLNNSPF